MNQRIRELAEQAGSTHKQSLGVYQFYADELEAFAKSIIQKTIDCCNDEILSQHHLGNVCCQDSVDVVKSRIREYFGVE